MRVGGSDWLYAIGDVNGRALLTHMGKYQARIAADHILGRGTTASHRDGRWPPRVIFTDPQVAAVGHTLASAREAGVQRAQRSTSDTRPRPARASTAAARRARRGSWSTTTAR